MTYLPMGGREFLEMLLSPSGTSTAGSGYTLKMPSEMKWERQTEEEAEKNSSRCQRILCVAVVDTSTLVAAERYCGHTPEFDLHLDIMSDLDPPKGSKMTAESCGLSCKPVLFPLGERLEYAAGQHDLYADGPRFFQTPLMPLEKMCSQSLGIVVCLPLPKRKELTVLGAELQLEAQLGLGCCNWMALKQANQLEAPQPWKVSCMTGTGIMALS
ncbi:hypothetical protein NDU88_005686 [Pleurodeles waltl]|uniref:Uncharacterized protein n=1 Tax=Pleurodeles waltl TaxID=8319 RepID=A0AAV7UIQ5_PLEWA|nr:hypothetical protein NDU88_005686 [Pleurodeles waltl]